MNINLLRQAVQLVPEVTPHLSQKARFYFAEAEAYKSYDFMLSRVDGLVRGVYTGNVGGDFVDIMGSLIKGQMEDAYRQAWNDEGYEGVLPDYLVNSLDAFVIQQANFDWIYGFYKDIVDAKVDNTSIDPLLSRAKMWAGQWNTAYQRALELIRLNNGGNLMWVKGQTERGCNTCANLDGIVMSAKEWDMLGVHPRGYPNNKLECEGGGPANNCDCTLSPTDKRRSPNAYGRVEEIIFSSKSIKGGDGSGNFGHAGRPGEVGGSAPSGAGMVQKVQDIYRGDLSGVTVQYGEDHHGSGGFVGERESVFVNPNNNYDTPEEDKQRIQSKIDRYQQKLQDPDLSDYEKQDYTEKLNNYKDQLNNYIPYTLPLNEGEIVVHELGHVIYTQIEMGMIDGVNDLLPPSKNPIQYDQTMMANFTEMRDSFPVSEYGNTNFDEYFSESFVLYMRGDYNTIHPDLLDLFKRISK